MPTQLKSNRKRAIELFLEHVDDFNPSTIDYSLDDWLRNTLNIPTRPDGQLPYTGWMVGKQKADSPQLEISPQGIKLIQRWEGCKTRAYQCSANVWTIGWGHTKGVKRGDTITVAEADKLLLKDLVEYDQAVNKLVTVPLSENQYDALVSFTYNVGISAFKGSTLLRVLNQEKYSEAANQFMRWVKAGNKTIQGLVNRRQAEKELFES